MAEQSLKRAIKSCILFIFFVAINLNAQSEVEQKYDILFKNAKIALAENKQKEAQLYLEVLISNYPNSPKNNDAIFLLEDIYIHSEQDSLFLNIFDLFNAEKSAKQLFWLGQAYYNLEKFEKAKLIFKSLNEIAEFKLKSKLMNALIVFNQENESIENLLKLETQFTEKDKDYKLILLAIARAYNLQDDFGNAKRYYENYLLLENNYKGSIYYEIAKLHVEKDVPILFLKINKNHHYRGIKFSKATILDDILENTNFETKEERENFYEKKSKYKNELYDEFSNLRLDDPFLYFYLGELSVEVDVNFPARTLQYYERVRELSENFIYSDAILYNIAYFSFQNATNKRNLARINNMELVMNWPDSLRLSQNDMQQTIDAYEKIYQQFPNSEYNSEAVCYLGIVYFTLALDSRKPLPLYQKAIEYFDVVVKRRNDPLYDFALFQRGWTRLVSGEIGGTIEDFSKILKMLNYNSKNKVFFLEDAIENMAYSLIEYDSDFDLVSLAAEKAKYLFTHILSRKYSKPIFQNAIKLKLKYSAPMQAIDLYNTYIDLYQTDIECPTFVDSIITIYKKYPSRARKIGSAKNIIIEQLERIVNDYCSDSKWYIANKNKNILTQLKIIENAFDFLEKRYYNNFVQSINNESYLTYKNLAKNYFEYPNFRKNKEKNISMRANVVEMSMNLAEKNQNPIFYREAIENLNEFNFVFSEHSNYFEYEENIFYCYEKLFQLQMELVDDIAKKNDIEMEYIGACYAFEDILYAPEFINENKNKDLINVIWKRAELRYEREDFGFAFEDYFNLLELGIDDNFKIHCYSQMAGIAQMELDYAIAAEYYKKAGKFSSEKDIFYTNELACLMLGAEMLFENGEYLSSAKEYLNLSERFQDEEKKKSAIVKAIKGYKKGKEFEIAIELLLNLAENRSKKSDILPILVNAWSISDSLKNWKLSEKLRNDFIAKFPYSNEAYKLKMELASFYENEQFNEKNTAAQMYLNIHDFADSLDIGEDKKENIFLQALRVYQHLNHYDKEIELTIKFQKLYPDNPNIDELLKRIAIIYSDRNSIDEMVCFADSFPKHSATNELLNIVAVNYNETKNVKAMLDFEKKYSHHPAVLELLKSVILIYRENNEEEKIEELAIYTFKKYPKFDILSQIVIGKLNKIKSEIDSLFKEKEYVQMFSEIAKFTEVDAKYKKEGLKLQLQSVYDSFSYYKNYADFYKAFDNKIVQIEEECKKLPNQLLKINSSTKWKTHLYGKNNRIENLTNIAWKSKQDVIQLIKEGNSYNLPIELRTKALYMIAKQYDYFSDVIDEQLQKFIDISQQLNNEKMTSSPVMQEKYKKQFKIIKHNNANSLRNTASGIYQTILITFYDGKNYSDEWTEKTLIRLIELKVRSPKTYVTIYSDSTWQKLKSDSVWQYSTIFVSKIKPEKINFQFIEKPLKIFLNGKIIKNSATWQDTIYALDSFENLQKDENKLNFETLQNSSFSVKITLQYDREKLEYAQSILEKTVVSASSWFAFKGALPDSINLADSIWSKCGEANFSFYKNQMYGLEKSIANPIWSAELDTTKVQTVCFVKKIEIENEIIQTEIKYIGQNITSIWIDGDKVVDSQKLISDNKLNKIMTHILPITKFQEGIIAVEVIGDIKYKGFIFEMNYIEKIGAKQN